MNDTLPSPDHKPASGTHHAMPDLAQRRRLARRVAWAIAAVAALLYLIGFFVQGG